MTNPPAISTHVLDTRIGKPAAGLEVQLFRLDGETMRLESTARTDGDGRIGALSAEPLRPGRYRIVFDIAGYAASQGLDAAFFAAFLAEIDIRDLSRSYHVPLILSPHSGMTYLGS